MAGEQGLPCRGELSRSRRVQGVRVYMFESMDPLLFWGTLALQLIGLASVVIARLPCRCPLKSTMCRVVFLACLLSVAVATMAAIQAQNGLWAWCGTTFSLMAVGVSVDLRSSMVVTGF